MNKRERLLAAAARQPVDRTPIALWRHFPGDDQRPADLAQATIAFQEKFESDFVKVSPSNSYAGEDWGAHTAFQGNMEGTREYLKRPIQHPSDWRKLQPLDVSKGALGRAIETLRLLKSHWGDSVPFIQTVFNPLMTARYLRGDALWVADMREHPDDFRAGLEVITDTVARYAKASIDAGAAGLFFATQSASYRQLSEREYRELGLPNDLKVLSGAGGWFHVLHMHGDDIMFPLAKEYPVQAVNWHDRTSAPSLREARNMFGGALVGGLSQHRTLLQGDPQAVAAEVRDALLQTGGGIGLVVAPGCVLSIPTPDSNLRAAIGTVMSRA